MKAAYKDSLRHSKRVAANRDGSENFKKRYFKLKWVFRSFETFSFCY